MSDYNQVDQRLHLLCQVIGKANRTYVPEKADESHTSLYFDPWGNKILGRWIQGLAGKVLFTLDLSSLSFEVQKASREKIMAVSSIGKTMEEIEAEIETLLPKAGLDPVGFRAPMPHEIPEYAFSHTPQEAIEAEALEQWNYLRALANQSCYHFLGYAGAESEVRIWPEHFDTGIYFDYADRIGIGFGLAMKDSMAGEAYFYMAGYPKNESLIFENLPQSGQWKWELGQQWKGVIMPVSVFEKASREQTEMFLIEYVMQNFQWYVNKDAGAL